MSRVVHIEIHGQRYAIRTDLDPQYVGDLALYVDEKMTAVSRELQTSDPLRLAVIAALNIADELHHARAQADASEHHVLARAAELERLVDEVLDGVRLRVANDA
ncbi:MAG: cell division protein ZapA [Vicinamibacterales bacterium]